MTRRSRIAAIAMGAFTVLGFFSSAQAQLPATHKAQALGPASGLGVGVSVVAIDNGTTIHSGGTTAGLYGVKITAVNSTPPGVPVLTVGTTYKSFCVDLYENTGPATYANLSKQAGYVPASFAGDAPPDTIARNLGAAAYVMWQGESILKGITPSIASDVMYAAMQLAVWEVTFDSAPGTLRGTGADALKYVGNTGAATDALSGFKVTDFGPGNDNDVTVPIDKGALVKSAAASLLDAMRVGTGTSATYKQAVAVYVNFEKPDIVGNNSARQDQIILASPEPGTVALAFTAIGMLGLGRWIKRRRSV